MTNATTQQPLRILDENAPEPYFFVPVSQLDAVKRLLEEHRLPYHVDDNAISLNGTPEVVIIDLGRGVSAQAAQAVLDGVE